MRRIALLAAALALVPAGDARGAGAVDDGAYASTPLPAWRPLPDELAAVLEAKSAGYARRALGFSCRERHREAGYRGGEARRERIREFDYLLVADKSAPEGFRAVRTRPDRPSSRGEVRVERDFPEPFLWSQLFRPAIRSTLRFRIGAWHTTPWKLVIPISWISGAPVLEGRRITEWTGTAEIEYRTGNLIRIVARPNFQDQRMEMQLREYLIGMRILGFSLTPPPDGIELTVDFGYEHEGYTYPTRVVLHRFRQVHRDVRRTLTREVFEYDDYRFFGTVTQERIPPLVYQPPADDAGNSN
ncbi:MAG: hypothetical protein D6738_07830 [Acidobacteria bacterium]|nr:MAG: hypothetical protein D6738_07830 [Acidobacteriota bacterium]